MQKNRLLRIYELCRGIFSSFVGVRHRETTTSFPEWPKKDSLPCWAAVSSVGKHVEGDVTESSPSPRTWALVLSSVLSLSRWLPLGAWPCWREGSVDCGVLPRRRADAAAHRPVKPGPDPSLFMLLNHELINSPKGWYNCVFLQLLASVISCWLQFLMLLRQVSFLLHLPQHETLEGAQSVSTTLLTVGAGDVQGAVRFGVCCLT